MWQLWHTCFNDVYEVVTLTPKILSQCYILQVSFRLLSRLLIYKIFFLASILEWRHHTCLHWWRHDVALPRTPWNDQCVVRCNEIHDSRFSTIYSPWQSCRCECQKCLLLNTAHWKFNLVTVRLLDIRIHKFFVYCTVSRESLYEVECYFFLPAILVFH